MQSDGVLQTIWNPLGLACLNKANWLRKQRGDPELVDGEFSYSTWKWLKSLGRMFPFHSFPCNQLGPFLDNWLEGKHTFGHKG